MYGGGSCPAVGATAGTTGRLTSGTTDANGEVALTIDVATTGASVCLVVLDANNKVVVLDSSVPMLYPGDDVQVWNKISTFLDVWLANGFWLSIDGVAIFVFDHACPAGGPGTSGAFWKATRVPAITSPTQWSIPIPPGPFCVAIGIFNDQSVNAWAGGTILLGDPVETGSTSSDVIIKTVLPGSIATITIQP